MTYFCDSCLIFFMDKILKNKDADYYSKFWECNIQSIEDISLELSKLLSNLKEKNLTDGELNESIMSKIELLLSIYSSYSTLEGREYLLKLKTIFRNYVDLEKKKSAYVNTFDFLISKINDIRNNELKSFPYKKHNDLDILDENPIILTQKTNESDYDFKWICFVRNGSSFVLKYDKIEILKTNDTKVYNRNNKLIFRYNDKELTIIDLFKESLFHKNEIPPYIIIRNETESFAVDLFEKKYLSKKNILIDNIVDYNYPNKIALGYVKLSGKRYIYLKN